MKMGRIISTIVLGAAVCSLVSCEDKAMVATIKAQKAEIDRLEGIEQQMQQQLKGDPEGNPTAELAAMEAKVAETKAEIEALEAKRDGLEDSRDAIVKDFEAYKRKYRVTE